jgi:outer membrane protein OmpA-like peptidoglycan-associated protein
MANVRSGHLVFGVGLVVLGYAVLVIALAEQAQRAAALAGVAIPALEMSAALPPQAPQPTAASATAAAMPTAAPAPVPSPAASSASSPSDALEGDARLFKFAAGGAAMSREEVQRLIAFGKVLAHRPVAKVSIEGFGDRPGTEALTMGIAKHRAKVAQMLLAKSGVTEDRVTMAFVDMGQDPKLAQMIRITTLPPLSEIDKP